MSSSDFEDYYIVLRCSGAKNESCFTRLKTFLLSVIARLMFRIRNRFSKIVINGKPLCKEPEALPPDIRRLSYKKLKKIKEALAKLDLGDQTVSASRPGYLPPPPTPRSGDDDIEIEVLKVDEKVPGVNDKAEINGSTSYTENADVHVQTEDEDRDVRRKVDRKPRPKAAKGKRTETAIPPYVILDEEAVTTTKSLKRKRPKAAKGQRKPCVENLIDLPAEILIESFQSAEERCRAKARRRPMTPRPRYDLATEEEDDDIDVKIDQILKDMQSPVAKRKPRKERQTLPSITETCSDDEDKESKDSDDDEDDIFNVPYLPKSQRKYAKDGLTVPWMK